MFRDLSFRRQRERSRRLRGCLVGEETPGEMRVRLSTALGRLIYFRETSHCMVFI